MAQEMSKTKTISKNRISLNNESKEKIEQWRTILTEKYPGIRVSDGDLTNWAISRIAPSLSAKQVTELKDIFFDEVRELEWRLAQAKEAKLRPSPSADLSN